MAATGVRAERPSSAAPDLQALAQAGCATVAGAGFDAPTLQWYVDYACRDDYGTSSAEVSARAADSLLRLPQRRSAGCGRRCRAHDAGRQRLVGRRFMHRSAHTPVIAC